MDEHKHSPHRSSAASPTSPAPKTTELHVEEMDEEMARVLRAKSGSERLEIANDMFMAARRMIASHLASEHPDWDEARIERETSRRISHGAV